MFESKAYSTISIDEYKHMRKSLMAMVRKLHLLFKYRKEEVSASAQKIEISTNIMQIRLFYIFVLQFKSFKPPTLLFEPILLLEHARVFRMCSVHTHAVSLLSSSAFPEIMFGQSPVLLCCCCLTSTANS